MQSIVAFTLDLLLLLTLNVGLGQCRSSGAPAELACAQMVPGHGVGPQTIPCPFETTPNEVELCLFHSIGRLVSTNCDIEISYVKNKQKIMNF